MTCKTCDGNGVIPKKRFFKARYHRWRERGKQRKSEPSLKMVVCPDCKVGGIR